MLKQSAGRDTSAPRVAVASCCFAVSWTSRSGVGVRVGSHFFARIIEIVCKQSQGELNSPVVEWLDKGLTAVWSPTSMSPCSVMDARPGKGASSNPTSRRPPLCTNRVPSTKRATSRGGDTSITTWKSAGRYTLSPSTGGGFPPQVLGRLHKSTNSNDTSASGPATAARPSADSSTTGTTTPRSLAPDAGLEVTQASDVDAISVTLTQGAPPMDTAMPGWKPSPATATSVPPSEDPRRGETEASVAVRPSV
eukprot:1182448-Prorocentrum_minimum.AAC.11